MWHAREDMQNMRLLCSNYEGNIRKGSFSPKTKFVYIVGRFFGFDDRLFVCLKLVYLCVGM